MEDEALLEVAAEALAIIEADDKLAAAFAEVTKARREAAAATALYVSLKGEVVLHQRQAARWQRKAKAAALCEACKVNLERDDV